MPFFWYKVLQDVEDCQREIAMTKLTRLLCLENHSYESYWATLTLQVPR